MARFAYFSRHALQRIGQRTGLNYFTIANMLDFGGVVDIGTEPVFDRKHLLLYSCVDDCCFVAIQDAVSGLVITVLPVEYHENIAWKVEEKYIVEAKQKAKTYVQTTTSNELPTIIIVKARYISNEGHQKTATLTKFKAIDYDGNLFKVLDDKSFGSEVEYHSQRKNIDTTKIYEVSIALGNSGEPLVIDWKTDVD